MIFDKNSTHVILKLILLFPDTHRKDLNEIILNNIIDICLDLNGICLFRNFIKTSILIPDKNRKKIYLKNFLLFYKKAPLVIICIQFLLENLDINKLNEIKDTIIENTYKLSIQQFLQILLKRLLKFLM